MNGMALRVPTPNVSLVDLVVDVKTPVTVEAVNEALKAAAKGEMKGILGYTEQPLVSIDFTGNENSSIIDGLSTMVMGIAKLKYLHGTITNGVTLAELLIYSIYRNKNERTY